MKIRLPIITTQLIVAGLLAVTTFVSVPQQTFAADQPPDPAHTAHVAAVTSQASGQALDVQLAELRAKVQQLEANIQQNSGSSPTTYGCMPAAAPAAAMPAGGMGMDKMEMVAMMGMGSGAEAAMPQSVLPGFPGASHLYHIGATDFFLNHPQHIALSTEQMAALNKVKEQALLAKSTADRAIEQAEQNLWTLTASDQSGAAEIEIKIREIGKLTGDARLAFIRAVGEASKLLTDEQRKILTGFAPPAPAMPAAGMVAPAAPMEDM